MLAATHIDNGSDITVVLLHGILGKRDQLKQFFDLPANILAVDLPGHGQTPASHKEPLLAHVKIELEHTLNHYGVKEHVLLGYSLGGFIAVYVLSQGWDCRGAILLSTGARLPRADLITEYQLLSRAEKTLANHQRLFEQFVDTLRKARNTPFSIAGEIDIEELFTYLSELRDCAYCDNLSDISIPLCMVHGARDMVVPISQARELKTLLLNSECTFKELEHDDHGTILRSQQALKEVQLFIKKCAKN